MSHTLTDQKFTIAINQDKSLVLTGIFFLVVSLAISLPLIALIFLRINENTEWWNKLFIFIFLGAVVAFNLNNLARKGFLWLVFGKEIITLTPTELILKRTRGFSPFQKHFVRYHTITDISISKNVSYYEYTGKVGDGVLKIKYDKDKIIEFGGRKTNETIASIYNTILNKSENIK